MQTNDDYFTPRHNASSAVDVFCTGGRHTLCQTEKCQCRCHKGSHTCASHPGTTATHRLLLGMGRKKYLCDICARWAIQFGSTVEQL